jgi:DNA modification methylase
MEGSLMSEQKSSDISHWENDIHQGDVKARLREMPESSVHMVMTSPPYYGLRDYGEEVESVWGGEEDCEHSWGTEVTDPQGGTNTDENEPNVGGNASTQETRLRGGGGIKSGRCLDCGAWKGQLGLEPQLEQFVRNLVEVGDLIRRVLREDGNWWLNLGDSFAGSWGAQSKDEKANQRDSGAYPDKNPARTGTLRRKSKMLVPHRVAIALEDAGWIVRSDAVWAKSNPMPHPVKDRLTETKEFVFHLTPNPDYWFDLDAVREPHKESSLTRSDHAFNSAGVGSTHAPREDRHDDVVMDAEEACHPNGKNPGDIFEVPVKAFPEAHFAVYPPELCEKPIKSSCPPKVCAECGTPYDRETVEKNREVAGGSPALDLDETGYKDRTGNHQGRREGFTLPEREVGKWEQQCDCETDDVRPGVVLDPFAGAGTTCLVAKRLGRRFAGIELNPDYVALAQKRVGVTVDEPERLLEEDETSLSAFTDGGDSDA